MNVKDKLIHTVWGSHGVRWDCLVVLPCVTLRDRQSKVYNTLAHPLCSVSSPSLLHLAPCHYAHTLLLRQWLSLSSELARQADLAAFAAPVYLHTPIYAVFWALGLTSLSRMHCGIDVKCSVAQWLKANVFVVNSVARVKSRAITISDMSQHAVAFRRYDRHRYRSQEPWIFRSVFVIVHFVCRYWQERF